MFRKNLILNGVLNAVTFTEELPEKLKTVEYVIERDIHHLTFPLDSIIKRVVVVTSSFIPSESLTQKLANTKVKQFFKAKCEDKPVLKELKFVQN